jgi:hypothetical protein
LSVTLDVLPTNIVLTACFAIAAEATLAFLGLSGGDQPSWGTMLSWALADPLLFMRPVWPWLILPPTTEQLPASLRQAVSRPPPRRTNISNAYRHDPIDQCGKHVTLRRNTPSLHRRSPSFGSSKDCL